MISFTDPNQPQLTGSTGSLLVIPDDEITLKLAMLYEGQCQGLGPTKAAIKFGYTKGRYFQLLHLYQQLGAEPPDHLSHVLSHRSRAPHHRATMLQAKNE